MKKTIAIALILAMCLSLLAACGGSGAPSEPAATAPPEETGAQAIVDLAAPPPEGAKFADTIVINEDAMPMAVLNPLSPLSAGGSSNAAHKMYLDFVVTFDETDYSINPALATSWEVSDDGLTYTFKLRDDVYWHDGNKFTANDVVFTWKMGREALGAPCCDYWLRIEKCTALDDYTLECVLVTQNVDFLRGLTSEVSGILSEKAVTEDPTEGTMIGTGPYKVKEFVSRDHAIFERNDDYWGQLPYTKTQHWVFLPELSTIPVALKNGEIQATIKLADTDFEMFKNDPDFIATYYIPAQPNSLSFNLDDPLMADDNFRLAVLYAMDRHLMGEVAFGEEFAVKYTDGAVWSLDGVPYRNTDIPWVEQDLDKAKEYLEASSYDGETVVLTTTTQTTFTKLAEVIQNQLKQIGINLEVERMDTQSFFSSTTWEANKTQMNLFSNAFGGMLFGFPTIFTPGLANNRSKLVDEELVELIESLWTETDDAEAEAMWKRAQEIVFEHNCVIPLASTRMPVIFAKGMGGIVLKGTMLHDLRYMYWLVD